MLLPRSIRKMLAVFRGSVSPVLIFLSIALGFWFGLIPGWSGFHTVIVAVVFVLNVHLGLFLLSAGIASFGHVSGVHYQNVTQWDEYVTALAEPGRLPVGRGLRPTPHQRLVRELILQLKHGRLDVGYFQRKFGVDILEHWEPVWQDYRGRGWCDVQGDEVVLTREGLLRADGLLPAFFEPEHQGVRYT